jgi:hypothetical protein
LVGDLCKRLGAVVDVLKCCLSETMRLLRVF